MPAAGTQSRQRHSVEGRTNRYLPSFVKTKMALTFRLIVTRGELLAAVVAWRCMKRVGDGTTRSYLIASLPPPRFGSNRISSSRNHQWPLASASAHDGFRFCQRPKPLHLIVCWKYFALNPLPSSAVDGLCAQPHSRLVRMERRLQSPLNSIV